MQSIALYVPVSSYQQAQAEIARIRQRAKELNVTIYELMPSGPFGIYEGEDAIKTAIASGEKDPTSCIKGTMSNYLHLCR